MTVAGDVLALLEEIDALYEEAVMEPGAHRDEELAARAEVLLAARSEIASADRRVPRLVRRAARTAAKLRRYWEGRLDQERPAPAEWRARVDEALGGRGWLPGLDLARWGLEADPSPELFEEVQERFRWAHLRPWMEGLDFEGYLASREEP